MLNGEEFNGLVGDGVISESVVLLYYETGKRDIWNSKKCGQCLLDELIGQSKVGKGGINRDGTLFFAGPDKPERNVVVIIPLNRFMVPVLL